MVQFILPMPEPEPVIGPRMVEFYLRDTVGGEALTGRSLLGVDFLALDEGGKPASAVALRPGDKPWTLDGAFLPGVTGSRSRAPATRVW